MGTRYDTGDLVMVKSKSGRVAYEVVDIMSPQSDSPDYVVRPATPVGRDKRGDRKMRVKASDIRVPEETEMII